MRRSGHRGGPAGEGCLVDDRDQGILGRTDWERLLASPLREEDRGGPAPLHKEDSGGIAPLQEEDSGGFELEER